MDSNFSSVEGHAKMAPIKLMPVPTKQTAVNGVSPRPAPHTSLIKFQNIQLYDRAYNLENQRLFHRPIKEAERQQAMKCA